MRGLRDVVRAQAAVLRERQDALDQPDRDHIDPAIPRYRYCGADTAPDGGQLLTLGTGWQRGQ